MSDIRFYEKTCYEERLKDDATQRLADALAGWAANGSQPPKPTFLHFLHEVSKERWAQESEVFRAEIRTANEADYEARKAAADVQGGKLTPQTPEEFEE